jgi:threonyl-tRNA synthetase
MIHRAVLGSVERMFAILLEHYKGKWPFWLSPRQAIVCPVSEKSQPYALTVVFLCAFQQSLFLSCLNIQLLAIRVVPSSW